MLWNHRHGRWFDLVWLIYSVFFFIYPVQRNTASVWILFACAYAAFLALYVGIIRATSPRMAYICMVAMTVLGLCYYPLNQSAAGIMVYVVAFAPFITDSVTVCIAIFAVVSLTTAAEGMLLHFSPWSWAFISLFSFAVGAGNLLAAQRMRSHYKLNLAHEEIAHLAKVAERERIARDLHDVLGHTLSVVVLKSELAGKLLQQNPERAQIEIGEVEHIARQALAEVREAIRGYRSEGLAAEIERARTVLDAAGVSLDCTTVPPKLRPAEETMVALIVREAVTNIVRHAQASHCSIAFKEEEKTKGLVVEDNGSGGIRHEGNGLRGMRERVESLGGRLWLDSGAGTRLTVEIPGLQEAP
ncbi:MAG TPA: sensor histidine kinase [Terracidiphilus sp.]|jgi:two-component system sensor histidine kinase DesK|nr:sensor histidine kinase [Terracidiphilus sp.]